MESKIKERIKMTKSLTWLRVVAALSLLFWTYWFFSDMEIKLSIGSIIIPFTYVFNKDVLVVKSMSVLIMPVLVNLALWIPCQKSYVFLKAVMYIELAKVTCTLVLFGLAFCLYIFIPILIVLLFANSNISSEYVLLAVVANLALYFFNKIMVTNLKNQEYKECFKATEMPKIQLNRATLKAGTVVLLIAIVTNLSAVYCIKNVPEYRDVDIIGFKNTNNSDAIISLDSKRLLSPRLANGAKEIQITTVDLVDGKSIKTTSIPISGIKDITPIVKITPDETNVIIGVKNFSAERVLFKVINIDTGKVENRFHDYKQVLSAKSDFHGDKAQAELIELSPKGSYFVVISNSHTKLEVWDYKKGVPIYTDSLRVSMFAANRFTWLGEKGFLLAYYKSNRSDDLQVYQYKILDDGTVKKVKKSQIALDMSSNTGATGFTSNYNEKYVGSITFDKGAVSNSGTVDVWDAEAEKKIFFKQSYSTVKSMSFHPNGSQIVILEELVDGTSRISLWNIETEKKEREFLVKGIYSYKKSTCKLHVVNNGKQLLIIGNGILLVSLE